MLNSYLCLEFMKMSFRVDLKLEMGYIILYFIID